jgi:hypothetical protein
MSSGDERSRRNANRKDYKAMMDGRGIVTLDTGEAACSSHNAVSDEPEALDDSADKDDAELQEMERELKALADEKMVLQRDHKKMALQQRIAKARAENEHLKMKGTDFGNRLSAPSGLFGRDLGSSTIHDLRKMSSLNEKVSSQMRKFGLSEDSSTSSSSESSEEEDVKSRKSKRKSKKVKSGITAKATDRVKNPQIWPHSSLQITHVSKAVTFEDLDFSMFLAEETEIIRSQVKSEEEMLGRLAILKMMAYYKNTYEWKALLDLYAAWLRQIELGQRKWCDDTTQLEHVLLAGCRRVDNKFKEKEKSVKKSQFSRDSKSGDDSVWFCSSFQRNKCTHMSVIKGKMRHMLHICASCCQKDQQKLPHAESSPSCPHMA